LRFIAAALAAVGFKCPSFGLRGLVVRPPDEFEAYQKVGYAKGFLLVSVTPLTRSSHHAGDDFRKMRERRRDLWQVSSHLATSPPIEEALLPRPK
jgi:hypothetical protein